MPIKDVFKYNDRWDSVGLDCSKCAHESPPNEWPDKNRVYCCKRNKISLAIVLNDSGYKEGEWFCKHFEDNGKVNRGAYKTFCQIKDQLRSDVLYGFYGGDGFLKEINFAELRFE